VRWKRMNPEPGARRCLTFELRPPRRQARLAVRCTINHLRRAAKRGCRSGSPLERGVRPHVRNYRLPDHPFERPLFNSMTCCLTLC
jgi:hypothetical protein